MREAPAVWFPAVRTGTGTDVFTERMVGALHRRGLKAAITWLPLRAEYAPWTVVIPEPPAWANVVHVNSWLHARFLPRQLPVLATIHHASHHPAIRPYKGFVRALYHDRWIVPNERRTLRRADRIVAVSRFVADTARRTLVDRPMTVIHNGVDIDLFAPGERLRQPEEPFRLLYVGGWKRLKGVDLLAAIMRELGDGYELRYTGGAAADPDKPDLPATMHDIGRLQGDEAVAAAMREVDALVFPSRSEGFGLVAVEAMACGLPVIATRGSALVEVVADGVTGALCPQDDARAFAAAVRALATDIGVHAARARSARDLVMERFSMARMTDQYIHAYAALSGAGGSGGFEG
jgi:glycosyltransferase involved in cell wall biosynthesis